MPTKLIKYHCVKMKKKFVIAKLKFILTTECKYENFNLSFKIFLRLLVYKFKNRFKSLCLWQQSRKKAIFDTRLLFLTTIKIALCT